MIFFEKITKKFRNKTVIENASMGFDASINLLIGKNGIGKSTLINLIAGIIRPNTGAIYLEGEKVLLPDGRYKKNIGFILNCPTLIESLTTKDYIEVLAYAFDVKLKSNYITKTISTLGLKEFYNTRISLLSEGYKKRVNIMASLIHNPKYFVWDEPFANLDKTFLKKIITSIIEGAHSEKYFLIATHNQDAIKQLRQYAKIYTIENHKMICKENV